MRDLTSCDSYDLILYDAMNCLTIAFFSKPLSYEGIPTGMQFGILKQIASLRRKYPKAKHVFLWEGFNSLRKAKHPSYKSNRRDKNDAFIASLEDIKSVLSLFDVTQVSHAGIEADDLAAFYCKKHQSKRILLVSNDRDWYSYVDRDSISIYSRNEEWSRTQLEMTCGFPPEKMALFKILRGDPSDKISPIPRFPDALAIRMAKSCTSYKDFRSFAFEPSELKWKQVLEDSWQSIVEVNADLVLFHPEWIDPSRLLVTPPSVDKAKAIRYLNDRGMVSLLHLFGLDRISEDEEEVVF